MASPRKGRDTQGRVRGALGLASDRGRLILRCRNTACIEPAPAGGGGCDKAVGEPTP